MGGIEGLMSHYVRCLWHLCSVWCIKCFLFSVSNHIRTGVRRSVCLTELGVDNIIVIATKSECHGTDNVVVLEVQKY